MPILARFARVLLAVPVLLAACARAHPIGRVPLEAGATLAYEVLGTGRDTVLVLHGGPALHHKYLVPPMEPLAAGRTLILYDMRGRGASSPAGPADSVSFEQDVRDLEAVRSHFRLERFKVVGHHWGAMVAIAYAKEHPGRITRMALVSPFVPGGTWAFAYSMFAGDTAERHRDAAAEQAVRSPADARRFCREHWPAYFSPMRTDAMVAPAALADAMCGLPDSQLAGLRALGTRLQGSLGADWSARDTTLYTLEVPTLLVEATDPAFILQSAEKWAEFIPGARVLGMPRPYGMPWLGDAKLFTASIGEFLGGGWPSIAVLPRRRATPATGS